MRSILETDEKGGPPRHPLLSVARYTPAAAEKGGPPAALGGPEGDICTLLVPAIWRWGGGGGGSGSGGSGGGGTANGGSTGSGGGTSGSVGSGGRLANFPNGENLGLPPGVSGNWGGILGAVLPIDPSCEFGTCLPGIEPFGPGAAEGAIGLGEGICILVEPCGAGELLVGGLFLTTVAAIDAGRYYFGKKQSNEWTDLAKEKAPLDPCGWLAQQQQLPENQDSATQRKIVQAQKFLGCRNIQKRN